MACELEKTAFEDAMKAIQATLKEEMAAIARNTEENTKALSDEFKKDNQLAQEVGTVTGTLIGGVVGGPLGAGLGATVGNTIGALFTIHIEEQLVEFSLDLPEFSIKDEEWFFDLPSVTMKDSDIIFDLPTVVMKTVEGPPIPETVVNMVLECVDLGILGKACTNVPQTTIRWKKTYLDVPTVENRQQRIVIGLPEVRMERQRVVVGVPQVTMKTQELSFSVPKISIDLTENAGKELAEKAKAIAADAAVLLAQKQAALKDRMRQELIGPAHKMFDCHRGMLTSKRAEVASFFDGQLATLNNSIVAMKTNGVPEGDDDFVALMAKVNELVAARDAQLKQFDDGLAALDEAAKKAIDGLGMEPAPELKAA